MSDPDAREGMARYGINVEKAYGGVSVPTLRKMAKELGKDHDLAQALWDTGMHEARMEAEVAVRTLKMANAQQSAVLELILKTMEMMATSLGQHIDVQA